jgi:hypothetical protein
MNSSDFSLSKNSIKIYSYLFFKYHFSIQKKSIHLEKTIIFHLPPQLPRSDTKTYDTFEHEDGYIYVDNHRHYSRK